MHASAHLMQQFYMHDRGGSDHPWLAALLVVMIGAAVALVVWALVRASHHPATAYPGHYLPPSAPPTDPALDVLRMRFARGEIDEAEYTTRAAHLQGPPPPGVPPAG
jgi:hypothetical protein